MTREEAITYIKVIWNRYIAEYEIEAETKEAIDMAISALSADRPTAKWVKRGTKVTCSNCKSAWSTSFDTIIVGMRYCPNCGARMKGGDDE